MKCKKQLQIELLVIRITSVLQGLTSSLKSLLVSFLMGSMSCTCPAEKPTSKDTLSAVAVRWLKS